MLLPEYSELRQIRKILFRWFNPDARIFPWRNSTDPYRVWVSEIMLQQTTTQAVVPYFERFIERFPDVNALADASQDELLRLWEGLGYYRRATLMHAAAKRIRDEFDGKFPHTEKEISAIPGIGRYTAGAILSIAFNRRVPILEANTTRLHARLIGLESPVKEPESKKILWHFAEQIMPRSQCGLFNQILMDFGALVCTPIANQCKTCPLFLHCDAAKNNRQNSIPNIKSAEVKEKRTEIAILVPREDNRIQKGKGTEAYLFLQYPEGGRWAGLWDFPRFNKQGNVPPEYDEELARAFACMPGCSDVQIGNVIHSMKHCVTRFQITLHFCETIRKPRHASSRNKIRIDDHAINSTGELTLAAGTFPLNQLAFRFLTLDQTNDYPLNSTARKFVNRLRSSR